MTTYYSNETVGVLDGSTPARMTDASQTQGKVHVLIGTFALAAQQIGDFLAMGDLPVGARPLSCDVVTDTSLASATLSFGTATSAAKYRAAATYTGVDTPSAGMKTSAKGVALAAQDRVGLTVAAAALPGAGTLVATMSYTLPHGA